MMIASRGTLAATVFALATAGCAGGHVTGPDAPAIVPGAEDGGAAAMGVDKVEVCHIPPGNPANQHTIVVGAPAVPAHLAHGDFLGTCEQGG